MSKAASISVVICFLANLNVAGSTLSTIKVKICFLAKLNVTGSTLSTIEVNNWIIIAHHLSLKTYFFFFFNAATLIDVIAANF